MIFLDIHAHFKKDLKKRQRGSPFFFLFFVTHNFFLGEPVSMVNFFYLKVCASHVGPYRCYQNLTGNFYVVLNVANLINFDYIDDILVSFLLNSFTFSYKFSIILSDGATSAIVYLKNEDVRKNLIF